MVQTNFNKIARFYDVLSYLVFRNTLKKSQLYFIDKIPREATILIVGGGTGWYLKSLLQKVSCKKILYVESSSEMIRLSKKEIAGLSYATEIEFIESSIENFHSKEVIDVVITNFLLDVFKEEKLTAAMNHLYAILKKDGLWLFCDFKTNSDSIHRHWQNLLVKAMYAFFRVASNLENNKLLPFHKYFEKMELEKIGSKEFYSGMIESVVYRKVV